MIAASQCDGKLVRQAIVRLRQVAELAGIETTRRRRFVHGLGTVIRDLWRWHKEPPPKVPLASHVTPYLEWDREVETIINRLIALDDNPYGATSESHALSQLWAVLQSNGMEETRDRLIRDLKALSLAIRHAHALVAEQYQPDARPPEFNPKNRLLSQLFVWTSICGGRLPFNTAGGEPKGKGADAAEMLRTILPPRLLPFPLPSAAMNDARAFANSVSAKGSKKEGT